MSKPTPATERDEPNFRNDILSIFARVGVPHPDLDETSAQMLQDICYAFATQKKQLLEAVLEMRLTTIQVGTTSITIDQEYVPVSHIKKLMEEV